jgi:SAM-dependent methyltransferase
MIKHIKQTIKKALYSGTTYQCPICQFKCKDWGYSGVDVAVNKELEIIGAGRRKNICVGCGSNDRERLVYVFLQDRIPTSTWNQLRILHIAPEWHLSQWIAQQEPKTYVKGDRHMAGYQYDDTVQHMDITALPFPDGQFDWVICNHVLEHIEEDQKAMSELYRVLKTGGCALLQVPISRKLEITYEDFNIQSPEEREKHFGQNDHVRVYGNDYPKRLKSAGFEVEEIIPTPSQKKFGLNPKEVVFICNKKQQN